VAIQLQFSLTVSSFEFTVGRFNFPDGVSNVYYVAPDLADAGFIVVNGWIGRPGDTVRTRIQVLSPNADLLFDETGDVETITDQLLAVKYAECKFSFEVPGVAQGAGV
jgi:hypothetical protein